MSVNDPSFCKWNNLDARDVELLADEIVEAYNKVQDISDGSSMFPDELRKLIIRVACTNSDGMVDVCDNKTCVGYCECKLPRAYEE